MKILAIETASEACSAALYLDGELSNRYEVQPRKHSELILSMMDELLQEANLRLSSLDALAFGCGPGSFTGVRIATGVIQGAAFGAQLPVVPVSTLATLAQRCFREHGEIRLLPAFDARMGEIYFGAYQVGRNGLVQASQADCIIRPGQVSDLSGEGWVGAGSGWQTYQRELGERLGAAVSKVYPDMLCSAVDLAILAVKEFEANGGVTADQALPVYLRDTVAWKRA